AATRLPFCPALLRFGRLLDGAADLAAVRFFAVFVIGISFGLAAACRLHRRSPAKLLRRRGGIPVRQKRGSKPVALQSHRNASPFWIMLLLRWPVIEREDPIRLLILQCHHALKSLSYLTITSVRFTRASGHQCQ